MNPCPCGYLGSNTHYCTCTQKQVQTYRNRVSGPVFDRMDILLSLKPVKLDQQSRILETSFDIRSRVELAKQQQFARYQEQIYNAQIPYEVLTATSPLTENQHKMMAQISSKQQWSNRVQIKIIRLARTIADLAGDIHITDESIWKAIQLRRTHHHKEQMVVREI